MRHKILAQTYTVLREYKIITKIKLNGKVELNLNQQNYSMISDINVKVGETFKIKLRENLSTGYSWALSHMPPGVCLLDIEYKSDKPIMIGSGGTKIFYFGAVAPCGDYLKFDLIPPGRLLDPEQSKTYAVIIN